MEWADEGVVVALRPHGETSAVLTLLTREHGRHAGLVRGARNPRSRALFDIGNRLRVAWRARLADHLGHFRCEVLDSHAAPLLHDPLRLAALTSAAAVIEATLPEREPHPRLYDALVALLHSLRAGGAPWPADYVRWELDLLADLGFGLDLTRCAVSGGTEDLAFVSPNSGQAVSVGAGAGYRDRLLPLPAFLQMGDGNGAEPAAVLAGLRLTGFFLDRHVLSLRQGPGQGRAPAARDRFADRLARMTAAADLPCAAQ